MTDAQRRIIELVSKDPDRNSVNEALTACLEAHDAAIAIARRVHAECGPVEYDSVDDPDIYVACKTCGQAAEKTLPIPHSPDCLWLAAEAVLKGVNAI